MSGQIAMHFIDTTLASVCFRHAFDHQNRVILFTFLSTLLLNSKDQITGDNSLNVFIFR